MTQPRAGAADLARHAEEARVRMLQSRRMADPVRPLKNVEYERLVAEGFFQDERIELLRGGLVAVHSEEVRPLKRAEYERRSKAAR